MSSKEKLLVNMAALHQKFKISPSKLSGQFQVNEQYTLMVDVDKSPAEWRVMDHVTGDRIPVADINGASKVTINQFILDFKELAENLGDDEKKKEEPEKKENTEDPKKEAAQTGNPAAQTKAPEEKKPDEKPAPTEKERLSREENERKLAMMEQAEQEEAKNEPKKSEAPKQTQEKHAIFTDRPVEYVDAPSPKKGEVNLVDVLQSICRNDLMQIYGNTGTGKTTICTQLAFDAKKRGLKVRYIDTEHNRNEDQVTAIQKAGIKYECIKRFNKLCDEVTRLVRSEEKWDFLIVDSAGAPALATYCRTDMRGQGDILKKFIVMSDDLKTYADDKNCTVVVVNQPESSMNKGEDAILEPFGEKSRYYYKEILKTNYAKKGRKTEKTTIVLRAHRSRCMGIDTPICTMEITNDGVKVIQ